MEQIAGRATAAEPAYQQSVAELALALRTDSVRGLTAKESQHRLMVNGPNTLATPVPPGWATRLLRQFTEPLVLLLIGALVISLLAWYVEDESGWPIDAIVIAVILIMNASLGAFQERRADQAVQALSDMTVGETAVIRDGLTIRVPVHEVVVGDLAVINEGDVIIADARLTTSQSLLVAEATLTGESLPVEKQVEPLPATAPIGDRSCMVYSGTAAVVGHGHAIVTATGMGTEVGQIADMLTSTEPNPTPLEREIARVSRFLGLVVAGIAVVISAAIALSSPVDSMRDVVNILIIAVSVAVAAVPEGLPAVLSIVLAVGVSRMARQNALVKRLASAETLGSASIICTDKTGTLTRNEMQVQQVAVPAGRFDLSVQPSAEPSDELLATEIRHGLLALAVASNVAWGEDSSGAVESDHQQDKPSRPLLVGDPTETALVHAAQNFGVSRSELQHVKRIDERPFHSDRKRMSVLVTGLSPDRDLPFTVITKGAPEVIIELCSHELGPAGKAPLTVDRRNYWKAQTSSLADQAMRTLLVASRDQATGTSLASSDEGGLTLLALVGLMDPPRTEAAPAIEIAQRAGIRIVMLTGDHPRTAASIATTLGIDAADQPALTGEDIDRVTDSELSDLLRTNAVFARVAPAHKLRMVQVLQQEGHVVAMTGDGVNDAPALKAADIGTAMGLSGTGVAREAADMVLTDDNFATIVEAVRAGRTIFTNVKSFLRYLLSSNVGEVLTIFLGVLFAGVIGLRSDGVEVIAPLTAVQILWINLLTDTGPAFALGLDPASPTTMERQPRRPGERVIDAAMQRGIAIVGLTMALATLITFDAKRPGGLIEGSSDIATAQTAAFTVLVLAQLFNCFSARSDHRSALQGWRDNPLVLFAVGLSLLLQVAVVYVPVLQRGFGTTALSLTDWVMATAVASSVLFVSELRKFIERRFSKPATQMPS